MWRAVVQLAAAVAVVLVSGVAGAGTFDPGNSSFALRIGAADPVGVAVLSGTETQVSLTNEAGGGHRLLVSPGVFQTTGLSIPPTFFGALPENLSMHVQLTAANLAGSFGPGFAISPASPGPFEFGSVTPSGRMGGGMPLDGQLVVSAVLTFQGIPITSFTGTVPFNSSVVGAASGGQVTANVGPLGRVTLFGGPFVTGPVVITGVTTPRVQISGGPRDGMQGAVISLEPTAGENVVALTTPTSGLPSIQHTVTVRGANSLASASQSGSVTLVSPMCIGSSLFGHIPGAIKTEFTFVPEPEVSLLAAAAIGVLALMGRSRLRRRQAG